MSLFLSVLVLLHLTLAVHDIWVRLCPHHTGGTGIFGGKGHQWFIETVVSQNNINLPYPLAYIPPPSPFGNFQAIFENNLFVIHLGVTQGGNKGSFL